MEFVSHQMSSAMTAHDLSRAAPTLLVLIVVTHTLTATEFVMFTKILLLRCFTDFIAIFLSLGLTFAPRGGKWRHRCNAFYVCNNEKYGTNC